MLTAVNPLKYVHEIFCFFCVVVF